MNFASPLERGRLLRRYKRFLADIELDAGTVVTAHCPNPGSMSTCIVEGGVVWLSHHSSPRRKLEWTWELAEVEGEIVYLNPVALNAVVAEAIEAGRVAELGGYVELRREVRIGERSRVDFQLLSSAAEGREGESDRCWVEVKSATLHLGGGLIAFPDAVTQRGRRHLEELARARRAGSRAVLLWCASRSGARSVCPADHIDPAYGHALRQAIEGGVELLAYRLAITQRGVSLAERVPALSRLPSDGASPERSDGVDREA